MEYHDILIKSSELRTTNKWFKTIEKKYLTECTFSCIINYVLLNKPT